jgi:hypothetical protein
MLRKLIIAAIACGIAQTAIADDCGHSYSRGCDRPVDCSKPKGGVPESAPVDNGAFVVGPANGEVSGESNSLGLRMGTLRFPEVQLALPTVQLPSLIRFRKNAAMHTESTTAPYVTGPRVGQFGLQPTAATESAPAPTEAAPAPVAPVPPACTPGCRDGFQQHCLPPCGEGCAKFNPEQNTDPWQNSNARQLALKEQQVAKLESQVSDLTKLVEQLVIQRQEEASTNSAPAPTVRPKSKAVNPWNQQEEVRAAQVDSDLAAQQAEQIAVLQAKIEELTAAHKSRVIQTTLEEEEEGREIAEPLNRRSDSIRRETHSGSASENLTARKSMFGKLGMVLSRR